MSIPGTWGYAWARARGAGADQRGNVFDVAYHAPAGTTLETARAALPYGTYYTGEGGDWGSRLRNVAVDPDRKTGEVLVVYHYEPPSLVDALIYDTDKVLVEARSASAPFYPVVDLNGNWVYHEERNSSGGPSYKWERVLGPGIKYDHQMQFRTRFVRDYGMGSHLLSYQSTLNGATYSQYWYCPTGTLRFAAWRKDRAPTTDQLWLYDCLMVYNPLGWNEDTMVQKYELRAYQVPLRDADGAVLTDADAKNKELTDWFPVDAPYYAELYPKKQWPLVIGDYNW